MPTSSDPAAGRISVTTTTTLPGQARVAVRSSATQAAHARIDDLVVTTTHVAHATVRAPASSVQYAGALIWAPVTLGPIASSAAAPGPTFSAHGGAPPGPVPPPVTAWTSRLAVNSFDRWGNILGLLSDSSGRTWQDQINEVGAGQATIDAYNPDDTVNPERTTVPYRGVLRFFQDGAAVFQSLIENKTTTAIDQGEEESETVVIKGRGSIAIFEEALVYPYGGLSWYPFSDKRVFDFSSPEVNEGNWPSSAVEIKTQGNQSQPYSGAPDNWPAPDAKWMWDRGGPGPYPVGFVYFKKRMYLAEETNVRFFITADDGFDLRVDGAQVASAAQAAEQKDFIWSKTTTVDLWLSPGVHTVAIRGENVVRSSVATNVAGVLFACYAISGSGQLLPAPAIPNGPVQPIMTSDASWKCWGYPATPPGLPIGETFHVLFNEAKARGCFGVAEKGVPYADLGFSTTHDSAGNLWPSVEFGFTCGANLLNVIFELADTYVDFRMRPAPGIGQGGMPAALILDAYVAPMGSTPGVTLTPGTNLSSLGYDGKV